MIQDRNQGDSRDRAGGPDPRGHTPSPGDLSACLVPIRVCHTHQISMSPQVVGVRLCSYQGPRPPALPTPGDGPQLFPMSWGSSPSIWKRAAQVSGPCA